MQNSPRKARYPRARPDLTFRPVDGHFVLTDRAGTQAERLTLMAALVWTYCDGHHPPEVIAQAIARELPEPGEDLQARVTALLALFTRQGIVS